jgi:5-deoxy-glucuronate isomerase
MQLLVRPPSQANNIETYGFEYLGFSSQRLEPGETLTGDTGERELAVVALGGKFAVDSGAGSWPSIGGRPGVFAGLPHALYLPIATSFRLTAVTVCDLAFCWARASRIFPARMIAPADVEVEIRGGGNATRQIHHILPAGFPADRLLVVEVYTPSGNWSSYPPHKHDRHEPPGEVDLDEIYYYRVDHPSGYAIQKVYTPDRSIDETMTVRDGDLVLVPEGYHPVVAAHGYNVYYLNALAGSARSMAASDDPDYAWVRQTWHEKDPRLPLVR